MIKGLTLNVYRSADGMDCTAGGISSKHTQFTLVGTLEPAGAERANTVKPMPKDSRVFAPTKDRPAVALEVRHIGGPVLSIVPVIQAGENEYRRTYPWTMAGGNYAETSDSRLGELIRSITGQGHYGAISVHDRVEQ